MSVAQYPPTRGRARGNRNLRTATRLPSPTHSTNTQHRCLRRLRDALAALAVLAALTSPPPFPPCTVEKLSETCHTREACSASKRCVCVCRLADTSANLHTHTYTTFDVTTQDPQHITPPIRSTLAAHPRCSASDTPPQDAGR